LLGEEPLAVRRLLEPRPRICREEQPVLRSCSSLSLERKGVLCAYFSDQDPAHFTTSKSAFLSNK
ncbi:PREDICTED: small nuclear protein PRAC1, partial [Galeopterus variegatus]|uniref:Small nuclear protein PRAC1 n=1 Tax=Galeopterus variegatus TaxID=482537 RepID=A0ABM0Q436_GALVR